MTYRHWARRRKILEDDDMRRQRQLIGKEFCVKAAVSPEKKLGPLEVTGTITAYFDGIKMPSAPNPIVVWAEMLGSSGIKLSEEDSKMLDALYWYCEEPVSHET